MKKLIQQTTSVFVKNPASEYFLESAISLLPVSSQYIIYTADESLMVFQMKKDFEESFPGSPSYCANDSIYSCFRNTVNLTAENMEIHSTGAILLMAIGSLFIFKDKKEQSKFLPEPDPGLYPLQLADLTLNLARIVAVSLEKSRIFQYKRKDDFSRVKQVARKIASTDISVKVGSLGTMRLIDSLANENEEVQSSLLVDFLNNETFLVETVELEIASKFSDTTHSQISDMLYTIIKSKNSGAARAKQAQYYLNELEKFDF